MKKKLNKSGISLIVLVITIIIMIILAAAIILSLNSSGIIEKANKAKTDSDIANKKHAAAVALAEYDLLVNSNDPSVQGKTATQYVREKLQAQGIDASDVTITDAREIVIGTTVASKQWSLPEGDTTVNVGDLLTPTVTGLENEKFYVIADDGEKLTLLAEKCINTGTNEQVPSGYSTVAFGSTNVYANSSIRGLVKDYVDTLTGLDLEDVEEAYGGTAVSGRKGRLMWYEEAIALKNSYSDMIYGPSTARINYWLGSPIGDDGFSAQVVAGVNSELDCESVGIIGLGLRPVIKILQSKV